MSSNIYDLYINVLKENRIIVKSFYHPPTNGQHIYIGHTTNSVFGSLVRLRLHLLPVK